MSFRGRCFSAVFALLFFPACLHFDGTPVSSQPLVFDPGSAQCLSGASVTLANLFGGSGDAASVNRLFDCARDSLTLFTKNVRGANPSAYSPDELRAFMEKYFLGGTVISDPLLAQVMTLKTLLFGGAQSAITQTEIGAALSLIETTREQALALMPWFPLTSDHLQTLSADEFAGATAAIQYAARTYAGILQSQGQTYAFSDFDAFLENVIPILDSADARSALSSLQAHLGGIRDVKQLLAPSTVDAIGGQEWQGLFSDAQSAYTLWLTYWNLNQQFSSFTVGEGRAAFVGWTRQVLAFLGSIVSRHGEAGIPLSTVNGLASDWLGTSVTIAGYPVDLPTLEGTLVPIFNRLLVGNSFDGSGHRVLGTGVGSAVIAKLGQYLTEWNSGQSYLEAAFFSAGLSREVTDDGSAPLNWLGLQPAQLGAMSIPELLGADNSDSTALASAARLRELMLAPETWQLFGPSDGEISFPDPQDNRRHSFNDVTQLNWMYEVALVLMRGYVDDPSRMPPENGALGKALYSSGALQSEVVQFYQDFKPFGVEIKLFAPDDNQVPIARFRDANIFLYAANGGNLLNPEEGQQLFAFLVSADRLADRFHFAIAANCPTGPLDIYGWVTVDAACYRRALFAQRQTFFRNMPGLLHYYNGLTATAATNFEELVEQASRQNGFSNAMFGQDDAQRVAAILQYVEGLFARYDINGDGVIDKKEAEAAFPVIESRLAQASCLTKESELHALFTYLLKNGTPPTKNLLGDLNFISWMVSQDWQSYSADRSRILQIFAQLSEQLDAAAPCK